MLASVDSFGTRLLVRRWIGGCGPKPSEICLPVPRGVPGLSSELLGKSLGAMSQQQTI